MSDLSGKTAIVTGANSGIGFVITRELARAGAHVVMACRSAEKAQAAMQRIQAAVPTASLELRHVDLASQASVRAFAAEFLSAHERLDVLVNNAGTNAKVRETNDAGLERVFATNVLGPFLLTQLLLPLLRRSAPARVVNVASEFAGDLELDDLQMQRRRFNHTRAYRQSKACNRVLTWALAERLRDTGVTANATTPGLVVSTGIYRDLSKGMRVFMGLLGRLYGNRTPAIGADGIVWLASAPELDGVSGKFFIDRKEAACEYRDPALQDQLWSECERLTAEKVGETVDTPTDTPANAAAEP